MTEIFMLFRIAILEAGGSGIKYTVCIYVIYTSSDVVTTLFVFHSSLSRYTEVSLEHKGKRHDV
jgi:hypothetical protein